LLDQAASHSEPIHTVEEDPGPVSRELITIFQSLSQRELNPITVAHDPCWLAHLTASTFIQICQYVSSHCNRAY